ncbi:MAG: hypothetical protein JRN15_01420 [Nitrososphaerota archaeon]|nr:hypothetical protein [Nitrososphaerota archaeon]
MARDSSMPALYGIFAAAWLLVLLGATIVFKFIVPFSFCNCMYDGVAKAILAAILGGAWLLIMVAMRNFLVSRTLTASPRSS